MTCDRPDVNAFADLPGWGEAIDRLRVLVAEHGDQARQRAQSYASRYQDRRAAMVFDVVASRRRRYTAQVLPMVDRFAETPAAASLADLAHLGVPPGFGLMSGEADTMQAIARGLVRFCERHGHDDEGGARSWAAWVAPFEHAPPLDPYVGSVNGIGIALMAYMRMRAGADAIKPDIRVRRSLKRLGFPVPAGEHALLLVAHAAAREVSLTRLALDQLLWFLD